jgi:hypothetical protein
MCSARDPGEAQSGGRTLIRPLIPLFFLVTMAFGQNIVSQEQAKSWMISHFQIPPDAKITGFAAFGNPVHHAYIGWQIHNPPHWEIHFRDYDFETQTITKQSDDSN